MKQRIVFLNEIVVIGEAFDPSVSDTQTECRTVLIDRSYEFRSIHF